MLHIVEIKRGRKDLTRARFNETESLKGIPNGLGF